MTGFAGVAGLPNVTAACGRFADTAEALRASLRVGRPA